MTVCLNTMLISQNVYHADCVSLEMRYLEKRERNFHPKSHFLSLPKCVPVARHGNMGINGNSSLIRWFGQMSLWWNETGKSCDEMGIDHRPCPVVNCLIYFKFEPFINAIGTSVMKNKTLANDYGTSQHE